MTTLALVDLDNLFNTLAEGDRSPGPWVPALVKGGHRWIADDDLDAADAPTGDRSPCVVVAAANTVTIKRYDIERPFLERFARRVARVLGHVAPRLVTLELAMVLPMPQAADRALLQLLKRAPSPAAVGPFDAVALVTADHGLIAEVEGRLGSRWAKRATGAGRPLLTTFTLPVKLGGGHARRYAEPSPGDAPSAPPPAGANALWIDTPEASAWAATQPVQRAATLVETARAVEQHPARLTQLSTTRASFRGVARLLAPEAAVVGACSPADGLELAVDVPTETRHPGERLLSSVLGEGVVRVAPLGATVRTHLPAAWLMRQPLHDDVVLGPRESRLADGELLARAVPLAPAGGMVRVGLRARPASSWAPASLLASVHVEASGEVPGWWTTSGARRPRSTLAVPGAERLTRGRVDALARHAVLPDGARRELVLVAPRVGRAVAVAAAPRGTIVEASWAPGCPTVALLSLDRDLAAGDALAVIPIQELDADALAQRCPVAELPPEVWQQLRRLPLLVPVS